MCFILKSNLTRILKTVLTIFVKKVYNFQILDSEGLQLAKFNQLPTFISNEKQKLCDAQKMVDQKKKYLKKIFNDYYKVNFIET